MRPGDLLVRLAQESLPSDTDSHSSDSGSTVMDFFDSGRSKDKTDIASTQLTQKDRRLKTDQRNAKGGSYWIHNRDGEDYPVIVCDREMATKYLGDGLDPTLHLYSHSNAATKDNTKRKKSHACMYTNDLKLSAPFCPKLV